MKPQADNYRVVLCTTGSAQQSAEIGRALVERRLAACVNVIPTVTSIYRWQGQVTEDGESLMIVKTTAERLPELRVAIRELHAYDTPEIIALPLSEGDPDYLNWLSESV